MSTRTAARAGPRSAPVRADAPPRRRRWLRRALALVVAAAALAVGVGISPLLDVESVEVIGVTPERAAEVRDRAGVDVGDPILGVWPGSVAGRVRDLPWVGEVTVVRDLPGTVRLEVVPRIPVGWVRVPDRVLVVDAASRVLWRADAPPAGLPELVGLAGLARPGGEVAPGSLAAAAGALGSELRARTAAIVLADGALSVHLAGGPEVRFGRPHGVGRKARVASAVLASLGATPVTYVDVSVPAAPVSG